MGPDGDLTIDIEPLAHFVSCLRKAPREVEDELMERMIAVELSFESLDLSNGE